MAERDQLVAERQAQRTEIETVGESTHTFTQGRYKS